MPCAYTHTHSHTHAHTQDVIPEWQTAASSLLSTLGIQYAKLVLQELLTKFKPGATPHFFVVQTLGQLSSSNGIKLWSGVRAVLHCYLLHWRVSK